MTLEGGAMDPRQQQSQHAQQLHLNAQLLQQLLQARQLPTPTAQQQQLLPPTAQQQHQQQSNQPTDMHQQYMQQAVAGGLIQIQPQQQLAQGASTSGNMGPHMQMQLQPQRPAAAVTAGDEGLHAGEGQEGQPPGAPSSVGGARGGGPSNRGQGQQSSRGPVSSTPFQSATTGGVPISYKQEYLSRLQSIMGLQGDTESIDEEVEEDDPSTHPPWRAFTRYLTSAETERLFPNQRHKRDIPVTLQFQVAGRMDPVTYDARLVKYDLSGPHWVCARNARGLAGVPWKIFTGTQVYWKLGETGYLVMCVKQMKAAESTGIMGTVVQKGRTQPGTDRGHGSGAALDGAAASFSAAGGSQAGSSRRAARAAQLASSAGEEGEPNAPSSSSGKRRAHPSPSQQGVQQRKRPAPYMLGRVEPPQHSEQPDAGGDVQGVVMSASALFGASAQFPSTNWQQQGLNSAGGLQTQQLQLQQQLGPGQASAFACQPQPQQLAFRQQPHLIQTGSQQVVILPSGEQVCVAQGSGLSQQLQLASMHPQAHQQHVFVSAAAPSSHHQPQLQLQQLPGSVPMAQQQTMLMLGQGGGQHAQQQQSGYQMLYLSQQPQQPLQQQHARFLTAQSMQSMSGDQAIAIAPSGAPTPAAASLELQPSQVLSGGSSWGQLGSDAMQLSHFAGSSSGGKPAPAVKVEDERGELASNQQQQAPPVTGAKALVALDLRTGASGSEPATQHAGLQQMQARTQLQTAPLQSTRSQETLQLQSTIGAPSAHVLQPHMHPIQVQQHQEMAAPMMSVTVQMADGSIMLLPVQQVQQLPVQQLQQQQQVLHTTVQPAGAMGLVQVVQPDGTVSLQLVNAGAPAEISLHGQPQVQPGGQQGPSFQLQQPLQASHQVMVHTPRGELALQSVPAASSMATQVGYYTGTAPASTGQAGHSYFDDVPAEFALQPMAASPMRKERRGAQAAGAERRQAGGGSGAGGPQTDRQSLAMQQQQSRGVPGKDYSLISANEDEGVALDETELVVPSNNRRIIGKNFYLGKSFMQACFGDNFCCPLYCTARLQINGTIDPRLYKVEFVAGTTSWYPRGLPLSLLRGREMLGAHWMSRSSAGLDSDTSQPPIMRLLIFVFADITELDLLGIARPPRSVRGALDRINIGVGVAPGQLGPQHMRAVHDILQQRPLMSSGAGSSKQDPAPSELLSSDSGERGSQGQQLLGGGLLALAGATGQVRAVEDEHARAAEQQAQVAEAAAEGGNT